MNYRNFLVRKNQQKEKWQHLSRSQKACIYGSANTKTGQLVIFLWLFILLIHNFFSASCKHENVLPNIATDEIVYRAQYKILLQRQLFVSASYFVQRNHSCYNIF
jgi:hypothetical protein